jgi:hypothetical protein
MKNLFSFVNPESFHVFLVRREPVANRSLFFGSAADGELALPVR